MLERAKVDVQTVRELLGAVRDHIRLALRRELLDFLARLRFAQQLRVDIAHGRICQRERDEIAAPGHTGPARLDRDALRLVRGLQGGQGRLGVASNDTLDLEGFRLDRLDGRARVAESFEDAGQERAELELIEQHAHALDVEGAELEILGVNTDLDLAIEDGHLPVLEHAVLGVAEVLALLRRKLLEVLEDSLEVRVRGDQLRRGLLADARDAGKVVARVAAQRGVLRILRGRDAAAAFCDAGFVIQRVVGDAALVVEHLDVRIGDELERITVAGDDHDVDAVGGGAGRERRDHVVGLDARDLQLTDLERFEHFVNERELRREEVGGLLAAGLVVGVELVAIRAAAGRVERDREVVGLLVGDHFGEHRREAVDGVGHGARLGREVGREGEEGPVGQRMAVEQQQFRHVS